MDKKVNDIPISEFYDDEMTNLDMFFSNGKKEFWRFDKVKRLGIDKCIIFFPRHFKSLETIMAKCELVYEFKAACSISPVYLYDNKVLIALCPLGGAAATNLMEELIFAGVKNFIGTGSCGAVQHVDFENYFIPDRAIRDEGTSYHYIKASRYVETNKVLNEALKKSLERHGVNYQTGTVWTTDAIYRETRKRIEARIKDGALGVEMETASLAAVAQAKGVGYSCLLYFSDFNNGQIWESRFYDRVVLRTLIVEIATDALLSIK